MPRKQVLSGNKSFVKGLITASTGLNYPANAVTDTDNVIYDFLGQAVRREGFNLEVGNVPASVSYQGSAISSFLWHNVLGDGTVNVYVVQIGSLLYFYPLSATGAALSAQLVSQPLNFNTMASSTDTAFLISPTVNPPVLGHVGSMGPLSAAFDGVTSQASGSCAAQTSGAGGQTAYIGQHYTPAQKITTATIYASSDKGWGSGNQNATLTVNPFTNGNFALPVTNVNITLFASHSDPNAIGFENGTVLATQNGVQGNSLTLPSNDITTLWEYVWFKVVVQFDLTPPAGPWSVNSYSTTAYVAEAQYFSFSTSTDTVTLPGFECQYASGLGYLFVTHPYCFPFVVTYTAGNPATYAATAIKIRVRDFDGLDDGLQDANNLSNRPLTSITLAAQHLYNLYNQGWNSSTITAWQTSFAGTYPSNCDVWWQMKNASGVFTPGTFATGTSAVDFGSTAAPKGRFIYDAFFIDRGANTPAGAGGLGVVTSNSNRPSTVAFFAGRVFYSGVKYPQFSSSIWFSRTISPTSATLITSLGQCYEENDPTSETLFDLLDTDGGVIKIADCGQIYKLFSMQNRLIVFASNGIWEIAGTKGTAGLGFVATDYTINRISNTRQLSGTSFVDVLGVPYWWTNEGVYMMKIDQNTGGLQAENISYGTINPTFENILRNSKTYTRGYYSPTEYTVQWLYRSTAPVTTPDDNYKYDSVLVLNTITNAFYTFSISTGNVNVASIVVVDTGGETDVSPTNVTFCYKYFVTYMDSNSISRINIADMFDSQYLDWFDFDGTGQEYTSTFTSGYKLDGSALMKFQPGYINVYSTNFDDPTSLLLHFDSDFTDSTENANVVTTTGVPVISTAQSKFGGASVSLVDSDTLSIADSSLFDPNEDFTIDFWYYPTDIVTPNLTLLHKGSGSFPAYRIYHLSNALYFFASSNGTANDVSNAIGLLNIVANTWYHIAITSKDNVLRVFVNGALLYTSGVSTLWDSGDPIVMSGLGFIDEFRYSRLARWTTAFTSPTAAYVPYSSPFKIQSTWEYTTNRNSGRWSPVQVIPNDISSDTYSINRVRTRGRGRVMQFKITSVNNSPFTIIGWVNLEGVNQVP